MNVLICGGGKIGRQLAALFKDAGHKVTVVEIRPEHVESVAKISPEITALRGDATDPGILTKAGAGKVQAFVAVTGSDEANMLSCFLAKTWFKVGRTIARVNDPRNEHMFTQEYGCDVAISYADIIGRIVVEETSFSDVVTLLRLRRGRMSLIEGEVHDHSAIAGKTLMEAQVPADIVIVAILRGEETLLARGQTRLLAGDRLVALSSDGTEETFRDLLR